MDIKKNGFAENNEQQVDRIRERFDDKKVPEDILAKKAEFDGKGQDIAQGIEEAKESGGSTGFANSIVGSTFEVIAKINGKHIDVDRLVELIQKYFGDDADLGNLAIGTRNVETESSYFNEKPLFNIISDGSDSAFGVLGNYFQDVTWVGGRIIRFLLDNKAVIESHILNITWSSIYSSGNEQFYKYNAIIYADMVKYNGSVEYMSSFNDYKVMTPEELLSIFVE